MWVEVNGAGLYVDVQGEGEALFALHGGPGMGSHAAPRRAFAPLAGDYRVITYDARGSGRSEGNPPYTHEQFVADLEALREHFGIERFILEGGSYGGFVALEYVLRHPERVTHLILRDTAASNHHQARARANALDRASEFPGITDELLRRMFDGEFRDDQDFRDSFAAVAPLYDADYDEARTARWLESINFRAETHNAAFSDNLSRYDLRERLGEIQVPTLVTVGRHDWITPVSAAEELTAGIPDAELVVFENSGHSPQIEENEKFITIVREFLEKAAAGTNESAK